MDNNSNVDDAAFDRVRRAIAPQVARAPYPTAHADVLWEQVPGGYGFVPVTGARGTARDDQTVVGSDVTVAELDAAAARLIAEGLGVLATLRWERRSFVGVAIAWGPDPAAASETLVAGLGALWPAVQAAVVDPAVDRAWARGEARTLAGGVSIVAPRAVTRLGWKPLTVGDADVHLSVRLYDALGWLDAVRSAIEFDPRPAADAFKAAHAAWHGDALWTWGGSWAGALVVSALVLPIGPPSHPSI